MKKLMGVLSKVLKYGSHESNEIGKYNNENVIEEHVPIENVSESAMRLEQEEWIESVRELVNLMVSEYIPKCYNSKNITCGERIRFFDESYHGGPYYAPVIRIKVNHDMFELAPTKFGVKIRGAIYHYSYYYSMIKVSAANTRFVKLCRAQKLWYCSISDDDSGWKYLDIKTFCDAIEYLNERTKP
jgi:hypothetical protein